MFIGLVFQLAGRSRLNIPASNIYKKTVDIS